MAVEVEDNRERSRYEAFVDGRRAGYSNYRRREDLIALDHTQIEERFEGRGVGSQLAQRALNDARDAGLAVLPFCQFMNDYIRRHPQFTDLVPESQRSRFNLPGSDPL
jgi:predicted GNAT family acetyltransferase